MSNDDAFYIVTLLVLIIALMLVLLSAYGSMVGVSVEPATFVDDDIDGVDLSDDYDDVVITTGDASEVDEHNAVLSGSIDDGVDNLSDDMDATILIRGGVFDNYVYTDTYRGVDDGDSLNVDLIDDADIGLSAGTEYEYKISLGFFDGDTFVDEVNGDVEEFITDEESSIDVDISSPVNDSYIDGDSLSVEYDIFNGYDGLTVIGVRSTIFDSDAEVVDTIEDDDIVVGYQEDHNGTFTFDIEDYVDGMYIIDVEIPGINVGDTVFVGLSEREPTEKSSADIVSDLFNYTYEIDYHVDGHYIELYVRDDNVDLYESIEIDVDMKETWFWGDRATTTIEFGDYEGRGNFSFHIDVDGDGETSDIGFRFYHDTFIYIEEDNGSGIVTVYESDNVEFENRTLIIDNVSEIDKIVIYTNPSFFQWITSRVDLFVFELGIPDVKFGVW